jgi:zinc transport system substrate-binding protein
MGKNSSLKPPASSLSILLLALLCLANVSFAAQPTSLAIYTVNYPLAFFAEQIGGEHVDVVLPVPPGVDPAFWEPDHDMVRQFQKADLILLNGAGYAKWTRKFSLPMLRMVDTSRAFKDDLVSIETNVTHSHGPAGDHSHGGIAFTTWLDFSQAAVQAEAVYKAILRKLPDQHQYLTKNFEELKRELLDLDKQMITIGSRLAQAPLFASHPIYQYLARRYSMNIRMMMWEPDQDPGGNEWKYLQQLMEKFPARWMIWEGKPLAESKQRLEALKINSLVFAPCMNIPESGNFMDVMRGNIENLQNLLTAENP